MTDSGNFLQAWAIRNQKRENVWFRVASAGKQPEKTYRGSLNVRLKPEIHKRANSLARIKGITLNQLISDAVEHHTTAEVK